MNGHRHKKLRSEVDEEVEIMLPASEDTHGEEGRQVQHGHLPTLDELDTRTDPIPARGKRLNRWIVGLILCTVTTISSGGQTTICQTCCVPGGGCQMMCY